MAEYLHFARQFRPDRIGVGELERAVFVDGLQIAEHRHVDQSPTARALE